MTEKDLSHRSLNDVDLLYQQGRITEDEVTRYLIAWNAGPVHTQAVLQDGRIKNFLPENSGVFYRHLKDKFGLRL